MQSITQEALRQIQRGQALDLTNILAAKSSSSEDSITSVEPFERKMEAAAAPPNAAPAMPAPRNAVKVATPGASRPALRTIQVAAMDKENITPSRKPAARAPGLAEEPAGRAQGLRP